MRNPFKRKRLRYPYGIPNVVVSRRRKYDNPVWDQTVEGTGTDPWSVFVGIDYNGREHG